MSIKLAESPRAVRTVALLTHSNPSETTDAVKVALATAQRAGCDVVAPGEEGEKHGGVDFSHVTELPAEADLCLVLGGDGTILKGLRRYASTNVPVFGSNFGTIGFLAAAERTELEAGLERAFAADFDVMELPGLEAAVAGERLVGLNDVSFTRLPHRRVAELAYTLGGQEVGPVRCDGLVAATPAGSTGYNLANQGPILAWGVEGYVVSFVAPHTLTARALVVAPDDVLRVGNAGDRDPVDVALDGEQAGQLGPGEELDVSFRNGVGRLAQLPGSNFYRRVREKFGRLAH